MASNKTEDRVGKTIAILGGGMGGHVAANELRKHLGREHRIVVIDKEKKYSYAPSYLWLMLGLREPRQISRDFSLLSKKGIDYVQAEVVAIDPSNKVIKTSAEDTATEDISYDYLIIALGAELAPEALPGLSKSAFNLYNLEGATNLRGALKSFSGGKIVVMVSSIPFKCPAAPYETPLLLDDFFQRRRMRNKVELDIFTPELKPMAVAGSHVSKEVVDIVERKNIGYHPNSTPVAIDSTKREISFEDGKKTRFDLLISIPPHRSPRVVRETELTNESGWIPVDRETLKISSKEGIYAIGDIAAIKLPGQYKPEVPLMLPKAGVFAHGEAEVVAHNIAMEIEGGSEERKFEGMGSCFLEIGGGKAGYAKGSFFAQPNPLVNLRKPARLWHWQKVFLEKYWLRHWF